MKQAEISSIIANEWLKARGVEIGHIAEIVYGQQKSYFPELTMEQCAQSVLKVLDKREVQNAILTGIQLDMLAEKNHLSSPLQQMIYHDAPLYGCDEVLALSIVNVYGSIGLTNFGYIDKIKPGIIVQLNDKNDGKINTYLDDIVCAIAAAACSRIAHSQHGELDLDELESW